MFISQLYFSSLYGHFTLGSSECSMVPFKHSLEEIIWHIHRNRFHNIFLLAKVMQAFSEHDSIAGFAVKKANLTLKHLSIGDDIEIVELLIVNLDQHVPVFAELMVDSSAEMISSLVVEPEIRRIGSSSEEAG